MRVRGENSQACHSPASPSSSSPAASRRCRATARMNRVAPGTAPLPDQRRCRQQAKQFRQIGLVLEHIGLQANDAHGSVIIGQHKSRSCLCSVEPFVLQPAGDAATDRGEPVDLTIRLNGTGLFTLGSAPHSWRLTEGGSDVRMGATKQCKQLKTAHTIRILAQAHRRIKSHVERYAASIPHNPRQRDKKRNSKPAGSDDRHSRESVVSRTKREVCHLFQK